MKAEFDKEIEALLRGQKRHAARVGRSAPAADADSAHTDADELSAYAENALPPATRARFTAHLADCDDCRRITTDIALAAGVATAGAEKRASLAATAASVATQETRGTSGILEWLAALFSPRTLRYAIPLLAVALTGVVAYVALRSKQDGELVAGRMENEAQRQIAATADNTAQAPASTAATTNAPAAAASSPATGLIAPQTADARKDDASSPAREGQAGEKNVVVDGLQSAPTTTAAPPSDASLANASKPAAVAQPEQAKSSDVAAPKPVESEQAEVTSGEVPRLEKKEQSTLGRSAERRAQDEDAPSGALYETKKRSQNAPPPAANAGARARSSRDAGEFAAQRNARRGNSTEEDRSDAGDRRAVAGYTFRRQGDKWVDERYSASMATSNISRGGDRFRSLAADFPEVESIASQLPGTVIVVLRGRAYRID